MLWTYEIQGANYLIFFMQKLIKSKGKEPSAIAVADPGGGSGGSRTPPIRTDACLRLKFLHRQDRISLLILLFIQNISPILIG